MSQLDDMVAMISGAARGLGRSHALTFAEHGADLLLVDLCRDEDGYPYAMANRKQLEHTAQECRRLGARVITAPADVRSQAQIDAAVRDGLAEFGRIDVLVNNAGVLGPGGRLPHELDEEHWQLAIDVNLNGAWRCVKAVVPQMITRRSGCVINIASTGGMVAFELFSGYVAAKHGVVGLTKALAVDYGRFGIRVNAVCPTTVEADTELDSHSTHGVAEQIGTSLDSYEQASRSYHPLRTLVRSADVSAACVWLASDQAARVTGAAIPVDAGFLAK